MPRRILPVALALASCHEPAPGGPNAEPEALILSPLEGSAVPIGVEIELAGTVGDRDHDLGQLRVRWAAAGRELCPSAPPESNGETRCLATLSTGEPVIQLFVEDPAGALGSDSVRIELLTGTPPRAAILWPGPESRLYSDHPIELEGVVEDDEDRAETLIARWEIDGEPLSELSPSPAGRVEASTLLDEGSHEIVLEVEDGNGLSARDSVGITVGGPNNPPACAILEPEDGLVAAEGDLVLFQGTASDPDIPSDQLRARWTSSRDGVLDTSAPGTDGTLAFATGRLSVGEHEIELLVTDDVGATCAEGRRIVVGWAP